MNLVGLADCKGVAVGALGHPRVELELLLQMFPSFLEVPYLGPDFNQLAGPLCFYKERTLLPGSIAGLAAHEPLHSLPGLLVEELLRHS